MNHPMHPSTASKLNAVEDFARTHLDVAPSDLVPAVTLSRTQAEALLQTLVELRRMKRVPYGVFAFGSDMKGARKERGAA